jgi:hypothetical protein
MMVKAPAFILSVLSLVLAVSAAPVVDVVARGTFLFGHGLYLMISDMKLLRSQMSILTLQRRM